MDFLSIILQRSRWFYAQLIFLGIFNGVLNTAFLILINSSVNNQPLPVLDGYNWQLFVVLLVLSLLITKTFQTKLIKLTTQINYEFEIRILEKLKAASFNDFDKLGSERVYATLGDLMALSNLPAVLINALNAFTVIIFCFVYLFATSWMAGLAILALMGLLLLFYLVRNKSVEKRLNVLRNIQNDFFRYLADALNGFKEVEIDATKEHRLYGDYIGKNRHQDKSLRRETSIKYMNNELTGNYSWFILIGSIMFLFPLLFDFNTAVISSFLITILYLMGPVANAISLIPTFTNVKIALERINQFMQMAEQAVENKETTDQPIESLGFEHSINFKDIAFTYQNVLEEDNFSFGPVNLQIQKGEVLFIIGGNGSGKSTFVNLLTGLMKHNEGSILVDGLEVTEDQLQAYRNMFSVIFTQPHLFSENYDNITLNEENEELRNLLELMELKDVINFVPEKNNIDNQGLSKGQQKRLALVLAILQKKPVMVLDEWAAEQDPQFRRFFYTNIVPQLKERGITLIAITHDDAYFNQADRIIKFDYGQTVESPELVSAFD